MTTQNYLMIPTACLMIARGLSEGVGTSNYGLGLVTTVIRLVVEFHPDIMKRVWGKKSN